VGVIKESGDTQSMVEKPARNITKKTRSYVVDGVKVTSSTYHVMADGGVKYKAKEEFNMR